MRLASRSGLIVTTLTVGAIAAPGAHAGGLLSGPGPDPPGAAQQEAQSFARLYGHTNSRTVPIPDPPASASDGGFDYGDAAVGAGIASGVALLVTAGTLSVRRHIHLPRP